MEHIHTSSFSFITVVNIVVFTHSLSKDITFMLTFCVVSWSNTNVSCKTLFHQGMYIITFTYYLFSNKFTWSFFWSSATHCTDLDSVSFMFIKLSDKCTIAAFNWSVFIFVSFVVSIWGFCVIFDKSVIVFYNTKKKRNNV